MRKRVAISTGIILALVSIVVWATNARVVWAPSEFKPFSIAPGERVSETVSFKNTGPSTINANKLALRADGSAARFVSIGAVSLPKTIKKGTSISIPLSIVASSAELMGVVQGEIVLLDIQPNGSVKEIFSNPLPIEITISTVSLPPDPGEKGKATIEGIDLDANGVRDDIDRYIVFAHPDSAKVREALKQGARAINLFMRDREDKAKTWENYETTEDRWYRCLTHVVDSAGGDTDGVALRISKEFTVQFLNTNARSRAYNEAYDQMGGYVEVPEPLREFEARNKASCTFNPDSLPN